MKNELMEKKVDKIVVEVVKHTEAIKGLVTREEFTEFKQENFALCIFVPLVGEYGWNECEE